MDKTIYRIYIDLENGNTVHKDYPSGKDLKHLITEFHEARAMTNSEYVTLMQIYHYGEEEEDRHVLNAMSSRRMINSRDKNSETPELKSQWIWKRNDPDNEARVVVSGLNWKDSAQWQVTLERCDGKAFQDGNNKLFISLTEFWKLAAPFHSGNKEETHGGK